MAGLGLRVCGHVDPVRCLISLPEGVGLEVVKGSGVEVASGFLLPAPGELRDRRAPGLFVAMRMALLVSSQRTSLLNTSAPEEAAS